METTLAVLEARLRLKKKFEKSGNLERPGGVRRKKTNLVHQQSIKNDDKTIAACLKRFGLTPMHDVHEVLIQNEDGNCLQLKTPKVEVRVYLVRPSESKKEQNVITMFHEEIIVDCRGHVLGRLCATVAKELLNGQRIVLVRCEETNISGSLYRNKLKYEAFLRKKSNTNPSRSSHIHHRSPSKIVWRTIRGMIPHKIPRGVAALNRLKVFEGIPSAYETKKRQVIPSALKAICLKPHRRFCRLGDMASRVGWKHDELVKRLEEKRRVRSSAYYQKKVETNQVYRNAKEAALKQLSAEEQAILVSAGKI